MLGSAATVLVFYLTQLGAAHSEKGRRDDSTLVHKLSRNDSVKLDALVAQVHSNSQTHNYSLYERHQSQKLVNEFSRVARYDERVESDLIKWFTSSKMRAYPWAGKSVLCVGARLGAEVRVFIRLGALAIGYDFNPGIRNPWVVYGTGAPMQWGTGLFDYVYTNIIDHIVHRAPFFQECTRVLKPGGFLINHVDQNRPDAYSVVDNRGAVAALNLVNQMRTAGLGNCTISKTRRILFTHAVGTIQYICPKLNE